MNYPMTSLQKAYYLGRNYSSISTKIVYTSTTDKDLRRFERAVNNVIREQPALRTIFNEEYEQIVLPEVPLYRIEETDLRGMPEAEQRAWIQQEFESIQARKIDVSVWPLFGMKSWRLDEHQREILVEMDMMIADGLSMKLFAERIRKYYEDDTLKPEENFAFFDFMQRRDPNSYAYQRSRRYWEKKQEELPDAPALPKGGGVLSGEPEFARVSDSFTEAEYRNIEARAAEYRTSPASYLLAVYAKVLALYSGQTRFTLNLPVFRRKTPKEMQAMGDFTSILLLDVDTRKQDMDALCRQIQIRTIDGMRHLEYDGVDVMEQIARERGREHAIFPYVFTSMLYDGMRLNMDRMEIRKGFSQTTNVYLDCQISLDNRRLRINWDYDRSRFPEERIREMFGIFTGFLRGEKERIGIPDDTGAAIRKYNETEDRTIRPKTLTEDFRRNAERIPDHPAVVCGAERRTYRELLQEAEHYAEKLRSRGVRKGDRILIVGRRDVRTVSAMIGILLAGGIYVPVDPSIPEERRKYIEESCGGWTLDPRTPEPLRAEGHSQTAADEPYSEAEANEAHPEDEAYIIYTSGSTGRPKGVQMTHAAAMNTIDFVNRLFRVTETDVVLGLSSFAFDLSVYDVFGTLSAGATLVLAEDNRDMEEIRRLITEYEVTIWNSVPAILAIYLDFLSHQDGYFLEAPQRYLAPDYRDSLRIAFLSGDYVTPNLPARTKAAYPGCRVISGGGATECAIWSIYYDRTDGWDENTPIPYGYPMANQGIWIVNDDGALCPYDTPGNICITGAGLSHGYYGEPEKTAKSFVHSDLLGDLYITGDLGAFRREGYVSFLGRRDHQVKINGYRVETGEIDQVILSAEHVTDCVTVVKKNRMNADILVSYVTSDPNWAQDPEDFRKRAGALLPAYMVPSRIVILDELPLTGNGKVDRRALIERIDEQQKKSVNLDTLDAKSRKVYEIFTGVTGYAEVDPEEDFFELGVDSIRAIEFYNQLKLSFDLDINTIFRYHTIQSLAEHIEPKDEDRMYEDLQRMKKQAEYTEENEAAQRALESEYVEYLRRIEAEGKDTRRKIRSGRPDMDVLITGGTGFLAAYLIRELLQSTDGHIYALVRAADAERAGQRLQGSLDGYFGEGFCDRTKERLTAVAGDVTMPDLGIDSADVTELREHVRIIYHLAAKVTHYGLYEEFEKVNVEGTRNTLEFARNIHGVKFFLISSTRVLDSRSETDYRLYTEYTRSADCDSEEFYARSKLEAERLTAEYREYGVRTNIMRVGTVMAEHETGIFQRNIGANAFYMIMRAFFRLGMFPAIETNIIDVSCVDAVADAIVRLSMYYDADNETFHIYNDDKINEIQLYELLREAGIPEEIRLVSFDEFYDRVYEQYLARENTDEIDIILLHAGSYVALNGELTVTAADRTRRILQKLGFRWPKPDAEAAAKMLAYGRCVGYFE